MTYQLEQARLTLTHEKKKEATLFRQVNNHKMWHARALSKVQCAERSIQGLDQVVTLLQEQDAFESEAFSVTLPVVNVSPACQGAGGFAGGSYAACFTPPHTATGFTVTTPAVMPTTIQRMVVNPYATPPRNLTVDLTLASEEHPSTNGEVREEGVSTTANLKTTGLTDDDYDDAKSGGSFPPKHGDDDDDVMV